MPKLQRLLILATFPFGALAGLLPLTYQSSGLSFNDWVSLFTLCFAPLLAHVLAGVPSIVYLSQDRPTWWQKLALYNPTTILWRYFSIADRRLRAKHWSAADLASSNVYFWTCIGWDGSEALIGKSEAYCVTLPRSKHATLFSGSTVKTLIVTLQGADSLYYIVWSTFFHDINFTTTTSVGSVFSPLTILGLLRLIACFWLTEEFVYINCEEVQTTVARIRREHEEEQGRSQLVPRRSHAPRPPTTKELRDISDLRTGEDYCLPNAWLSRLFRTLFIFPIIGLMILCTADLTLSFSRNLWNTTTTFGMLIFYSIFLIITVMVLGYYFIRDRNTTTVLPCISYLWYQIYTGIQFISMYLLIIIASLETWKSPCGFYTTFPINDFLLCSATILSSKHATEGVIRLAVVGNISTHFDFDLVQPHGAMSVLYFYGSCLGWIYENGTGVEGFQFVNTSDRDSILPYCGHNGNSQL